MLGCGRGCALDAGLALGIELAAGRGWPPPSSVIQPSASTLKVNRKLPSSMANPLMPSSMPDPTAPDCPPADHRPAVRLFCRIREKGVAGSFSRISTRPAADAGQYRACLASAACSGIRPDSRMCLFARRVSESGGVMPQAGTRARAMSTRLFSVVLLALTIASIALPEAVLGSSHVTAFKIGQGTVLQDGDSGASAWSELDASRMPDSRGGRPADLDLQAYRA
jgi:hypothetical protein